MNQELRYKGLSLTPDELAAANGTLALSANIELHNGALRPTVLNGTTLPHKLTYQGNVMKLLYVHKTTAYVHYITKKSDSTLVWFDKDGDNPAAITHTFSQIKKVDSVGNTVIVVDATGIHYVLWKVETGAYKYLGQKPPQVDLTFTLSDNFKGKYDTSTVDQSWVIPEECEWAYWRMTDPPVNDLFNTDSVTSSTTRISLNDGNTNDYRRKVTEAIFGLVNKANSVVAESGHFYANFQVRYCYRMYDNSMIMHSAPILMPVQMEHPVQVYTLNVYKPGNSAAPVKHNDGGSTYTGKNGLTLAYRPMNKALEYRIGGTSLNNLAALKDDWKDIIRSIDIFVSPQFVRHDDSKKVEAIKTYDPTYGIRFTDTTTQGENPVLDQYVIPHLDKSNVRRHKYGEYSLNWVFDLNEVSMQTYMDRIKDNGSFYRVYSGETEKLYNEWSSSSIQADTYHNVPIDKSVLPTIATQEQMKDDYKTHNTLLPIINENTKVQAGTYTYNHRLNLFGLKEKLFTGFDPQQMLVKGSHSNFPVITIEKIYVHLRTDEGLKVVKIETDGRNISSYVLCHSLPFYPDNRATKMVITCSYTNPSRSSEVGGYLDLSMKPCTNLNGAIVTDLWGKISTQHQASGWTNYFTAGIYTPPVIASDADIVSMPSKVYTSEADNPYYFPVAGINTVGTGLIKALSATTRAVSQGQFGQFPLIAFSTDGIWALDVSDTGTYTKAHPISREVASNPESLCQLDQQVVYATTRGLSTLVEQNTNSLSDMLLGSMDKALPSEIKTRLLTIADDENGEIAHQLNSNLSPVEFFQTAKIVYDFAAMRILLLQEGENNADSLQTAMVYSLTDGTWSTMAMGETNSVVNGYPHPYIQYKDGSVICLDKQYPYDGVVAKTPTMLLTRALTFGEAMYNLQAFSHNKVAEERATIVLFGSNNLRQWHYIGKTNEEKSYYLPSTAYKYFRIALSMELAPSEEYLSTYLRVVEKFPKI